MFNFCAICMVKRSLVELNCERRRFLEVLVSPFINLPTLKCYRVLVCLNCNRLLSTMLRFQQTVLKGLLNLVALHKRQNYICHNLPAVISDESEMLLPVISEEVVASSDYSVDPTIHYIHQKLKPTKDLKPTDSLNDEEKFLLDTKNTQKPSENTYKRKKVPIYKDWKPAKITTNPRSDVSPCSSATLSCESDFDNPHLVPGYNQVVSTSETYDHGYTDKNDMAVLVPIKTTTDNIEPVNTIASDEVQKTKLNSQLYKAIKLALKSNSISEDFDITQYEPESGLESPHETDSESRLESSHKKDSESRLESPHKKDSESRLESPHETDSESRLESSHKKDSESRLESPHEIGSTDSESTLSCHSNYEDAETFPNVVFANTFNCVSDDEQDENVNNKMHVVTDPPSEWPCTFEPCSLKHNLSDGDDNYSDDFEEDTYLGTRSRKTLGRRSRKKCNLCNQLFPNVYSLWVHYERDHVDVCNRECCNEKDTNGKKSNTKQSKVQWKRCAECGVRMFRRSGNTYLHYTSIRHRAVTQWRFQCDICKRKLKDKVQLALHVEREHSEKGALKCPMCPTTFRSSRALQKHAAAHILADTNTVDKIPTRKVDLRKTNIYTMDSPKTTRIEELRETNTDTVDSPKTTRTVADLRKALNDRTGTAEKTLKRKRAVGKPRKTLKKRARTVTNLQKTQNRERSVNTRETEGKRGRTEDSNVRKKTKDVVKSWAAMQYKSNTGLKQYGNRRFQVGNLSNIQDGFGRTEDNTRETVQEYSRTVENTHTHDRVQDYNSTWRLNPYGYKRMHINASETQGSNTRSQSQDGFESMQDNTHETQYSGNTQILKPYGKKRMRLIDRLESVLDSNTRSQSQDGFESMQDNTHETQYSGNTQILKPYGKKRMRLIDRLESVRDSNTRSQSQDGFESMQDNTHETQHSGNTQILKPYGEKRMRLIDRLESVLDSNTRSQSQDAFERVQDSTHETQYSGNTRRLKPYGKKRMRLMDRLESVLDSNTRSQSQDGSERMLDYTRETQYSDNTQRLKPYSKKQMQESNVSELVKESITRSQSEDGFESMQNNTHETQYSGSIRKLEQYGKKRKESDVSESVQESNHTSRIQDGFERAQDNTRETIQDFGNTRRKLYDNERIQASYVPSLIEYAFERTQDCNTVETSSNTQFKQYGDKQEGNTRETQVNTHETVQDNTNLRRKVQKPRWRPKSVRALRKQTKNARRANTKENSVTTEFTRGNDLYDSWLQIAGVPSPTTPS